MRIDREQFSRAASTGRESACVPSAPFSSSADGFVRGGAHGAAAPAAGVARSALAGALTLTRAQARILLAAAVLLALVFRTSGLATYGFSDDEINKVAAIEQYRAGNFVANAEHPMLMKLAMWASVDAAAAWNRIAPSQLSVPLESALRLPNAVAGAATGAALYGIGAVLFSTAAGLTAAALWAFDPTAISINRIGKEDTFVLLFFLVAVWCYERAKREGVTRPEGAQSWYTASGAAFGLMLASKYMPHLFGIYAIYNVVADPRPGPNKPDKVRFYGAMAFAFLAANPAILLPGTWRYIAAYLAGETLVHHGYLYADHLYITNVPVSPLGTPPTYYLRLVATKVPTVVLAALVAGGIEMARRHRERGYVLLRVLLVFVLVPYSLMAAKFLRYALPLLATLDLIAGVGMVAGVGWLLRKQWLRPSTRVAVACATVLVVGTALVRDVQGASPLFSLYHNGIGERLDAPGATFPEETYDYGVREAVLEIARVAAPSAVIASDVPGVVAHYLRAAGRADVRALSLSRDGIPPAGSERWVIVQREHLSFENRLLVDQLRHRETWREVWAGDVLAAAIYRLDPPRSAGADPTGRSVRHDR